VEAEEVQLHAKAPVIAAFRFFEPLQVGVELGLRRPHGAVDALEHRALLGTTPVRPGDGHELEGADLARACDVRALAQIDEGAVLVGGGCGQGLARLSCPGREVVQDLDLEGLVVGFEEGAALVEGDFRANEAMIGGDGSPHPVLDGAEVVWSQRAREKEVVVEAVDNRWPDAELCIGEELRDGFGHDVCRRVPHRVQVGRGTRIEQLVDGASYGRLEIVAGIRRRAIYRARRLLFCH
jgi:hypothetical protein